MWCSVRVHRYWHPRWRRCCCGCGRSRDVTVVRHNAGAILPQASTLSARVRHFGSASVSGMEHSISPWAGGCPGLPLRCWMRRASSSFSKAVAPATSSGQACGEQPARCRSTWPHGRRRRSKHSSRVQPSRRRTPHRPAGIAGTPLIGPPEPERGPFGRCGFGNHQLRDAQDGTGPDFRARDRGASASSPPIR